MRRYQGKVALVTGAGSGLGKAAALSFAQEGARVGLLDIDEESLDRVIEEIGQPERALKLVADVSDTKSVQNAIVNLAGTWSQLDAVFANAGINGVWASIEDLAPEEWDKTVAINLRGTFLTLKYAAPHLKRRGGAVVITSSVNGTRMFSNTGASAYASTKAAQVALAKMLALEFAEDRVRVNVICPGAIKTQIEDSTERRDLDRIREPVEYPEGQIPLTDGVPGSPEDVAKLVLFLCSDEARHVTGSEVWIDGAQSLLQG